MRCFFAAPGSCDEVGVDANRQRNVDTVDGGARSANGRRQLPDLDAMASRNNAPSEQRR